MAQTNSASPPRPIIILGVDRSGTSLVSELIWKWGAHPGDLGKMLEANVNNPQGYWEYRPMQDLLNEVMEGTGVPNCHPDMDRKLAEVGVASDIRDRALQLVREMESEGKPWFWKEPYLSVTLSFWESIWKDPIYVIPVRNPHDSATSFQKMFLPPPLRDGGIRIIGMFLLRWQHFMLSILEHSEKNPSTLFVPYEDLLRDPQEHCSRIALFLDKECGMETDPAERIDAMAQTVNPGLWRNRSSLSFSEVPEATPEQRALLEFLHRRVENPAEPFEPHLYQMSGGWREYLQNFDLIFDMFSQD